MLQTSALLLALAAVLPAADAVFSIGGTLREDALRIGTNLEVDAPRAWSLAHPMTNQWSPTPNIEPMVLRFRGVATGGSASELVHAAIKGKDGGAGGWDRYRDGFLDGASITIYRHENGAARVLRTGTVRRSFGGPPEARNAFELDGDGPAIQAGDAYMVQKEFDDIAAGSYRLMADDETLSRMIDGWGAPKGQTAELALDRSSVPLGGGRASLRVAATPGLSIGSTLHGSNWPNGRRLNAGKTYSFTVWLRQQGMATGTVELRAGSMGTAKVAVGADWKAHTLHFTGAAPKEKIERLEIVAGETGTLWIDNPLLSEDGLAPFAFYPQVVRELAAGKPGTIRIWALQENTGPALPIAESLKAPFERPLLLDDTSGKPSAGDLHQMLELCQQVGAEPWIVVPTFATPDEWRQLAEYLCGAASTPMGRLRAARGRSEPWSSQFARIYLDCGNETWNRLFAVQSFVGRPETYGEYAELAFAAFLDAAGSARERFVPVIGGWATNVSAAGFGPKAAERTPSARLTSYASYIGGWDGVGAGLDAAAAGDRWQDMAMFYQRAYRHERTEVAAAQTAERAKRLGKPGTFALYEAGPGYPLPEPGKGSDPQVESDAKSLARALTTIDMFLSGLEHGAGPQNFFLFRTGAFWASHATWDRPHAAWQAVALANSAIAARQLRIQGAGVPTVDLPEVVLKRPAQNNKTKEERFPAVPGVPLVSCWAWQEGADIRVALLNRSTSAAQPVRIVLPAAAVGAVQAQVLSGAPSAHNIERQQTAPVAWNLRLDGSQLVGDLPAASVAVARVTVAKP